MTRPSALAVSLALGLAGAAALAQPAAPPPCGALPNGALDYRTDKAYFQVVEEYHFTPEIEALLHGKSGTLGQEFKYTLSMVPNHHRALAALSRWSLRDKLPQLPDMNYSVECYYDRALRFRPDDQVARLLFANFLVANGRTDDARKQLQKVAEDAEDNAFTHYNIGLIYLDMKDYDAALAQAHVAYALGFPRPELRNRLTSAGHWKDAPPAAAAPAADTASATSAPASAPAP